MCFDESDSVLVWFEKPGNNKPDERTTVFPRVMAGVRRRRRNPRTHALQRHLLPNVGRSVLGEGER